MPKTSKPSSTKANPEPRKGKFAVVRQPVTSDRFTRRQIREAVRKVLEAEAAKRGD